MLCCVLCLCSCAYVITFTACLQMAVALAQGARLETLGGYMRSKGLLTEQAQAGAGSEDEDDAGIYYGWQIWKSVKFE